MWAGNTLVYTCILILQRELERRHGEGGTCSTLEYICILIHQRELERRQGECVGLQHTRVHLYTHSHRGDNEEGGDITIVHLYTHSDRGDNEEV